MAKHSPKFETLKKYYENGFWTRMMLAHAVNKGWISSTEYTEITGEAF